MGIFMVRLPAFGGSIEISSSFRGQPHKLANPQTRECDLRLSRAINLQKWPGPAALARIVLFSYFMFFGPTRIRDETWQSVRSAQPHSLSMATGDSFGGEGRQVDAPASGAPAQRYPKPLTKDLKSGCDSL